MNVTINEEAAKELISYFNRLTGKNNKFGTWVESVAAVINPEADNIGDIRKAMREWNQSYSGVDDGIGDFLVWYKYDRDDMKQEQEQQKLMDQEKAVESSLGIISATVAHILAKTKSSEIEQAVAEGMKAKIDKYILDNYGPIERKTSVVTELGAKEVVGIVHEKFETVMKFVANNEPVYLVGPAGSGKNVICKQVAEALGLEFYFTNAVTQEYKLTGFTDANGHFHESQFYKAFKNGGIFMLDEMDASIPEVLIILNAAIANRYFDFPAPIGKIEAHKDFRVIAAGNTFGHGADINYVGRSALDAASLDRFALVDIGYDRKICLNVTFGNDELVDFCDAYRASAYKAGLQVIVSYRAMSRLAKMESLLGARDAIRSCLVKGLEKDDLHIILKELRCNNKYAEALRRVENECY